jgi:hypothetical protein
MEKEINCEFVIKSLVILKKKPYYIMALNEMDAIEICKKYGSEVVGVVCSSSEITFKSVVTSVSLEVPKVHQIEFNSEEGGEEDEQILEEVPGDVKQLS